MKAMNSYSPFPRDHYLSWHKASISGDPHHLGGHKATNHLRADWQNAQTQAAQDSVQIMFDGAKCDASHSGKALSCSKFFFNSTFQNCTFLTKSEWFEIVRKRTENIYSNMCPTTKGSQPWSAAWNFLDVLADHELVYANNRSDNHVLPLLIYPSLSRLHAI